MEFTEEKLQEILDSFLLKEIEESSLSGEYGFVKEIEPNPYIRIKYEDIIDEDEEFFRDFIRRLARPQPRMKRRKLFVLTKRIEWERKCISLNENYPHECGGIYFISKPIELTYSSATYSSPEKISRGKIYIQANFEFSYLGKDKREWIDSVGLYKKVSPKGCDVIAEIEDNKIKNVEYHTLGCLTKACRT